jgi:signal transduction histidine kinase
MAADLSYRPALITGLSARLLALTIVFVMLSEVLIYVPSISRFRNIQLEDHIARAHLAILALDATPDRMVGGGLQRDLLLHAGAYGVVLTAPDRRMLMLGPEAPPPVDVAFDLRRSTVEEMITQAFVTLAQPTNRILRVTGASPRAPDTTIEVVIDEAPIRAAMIDYSIRILTLSILISLLTASLVYLSLHWLMVRPMLNLSECMMRFRENPEDDRATVSPSARGDEIGIVSRELAAMQRDLRAALHQKTRLAALGAAVAKINHDLRNTLSSAVLASDRLAGIDQPEVKRVVPQIIDAIDRATALCERTLDFARSDRPLLRTSIFTLAELIDDLATAFLPPPAGGDGIRLVSAGTDVAIEADRDQLFRALGNLMLNAVQAGATRLRIEVGHYDGILGVDVADDGPGIPPVVRKRLFQPFSGSGHDGSGLGLVIAREIATAHGGDLKLARTGTGGTTFRLELPGSRVRS